ncbi:hypothetical protein KPA94_20635 [Burkholderia semiarida]|uniref:hypothetical protein n=1 Tax=Burkholderia semiarida TaxID=2843303 RepID=UPI0023DE03A7|nr:hypothetical protein [Burkholderia semiarida]MDF3115835.1 hypothetical protein [Burkholderia semiarida]
MKVKDLFNGGAAHGTAIGIAGFVLGLTFACFLGRLPGNSSEWASWVQAVGSILAILGAFLVAHYQGQQQLAHVRENSDKARLSEGELAYVFAKDTMAAIFVANTYINDFQNGRIFSFSLERVSDAQNSLKFLYGRSMPSELLSDILELQRLATYSAQAIREFNSSSGSTYLHPNDRTRAKARMQSTDDALNRIKSWLDAERAKHGFEPAPDIL